MFDTLHEKLESAFKKITGRGTLNESDVAETMREVRMALLEADVNFKVAKDFCAAVQAKATGQDILKSLSPSQQVIKIVNDELTAMMGGEAKELNLRAAPPAIIMLVGLQGSGKTTSCGKLARYLRDELKRRPLLVPADVYRPAAIEQLKTLGRQLGIEAFDSKADQKPLDIARNAKTYAVNHGYDTMILDTAGRLQIDDLLMDELKQIVSSIEPHETLLVCDAMTGQESVNVALGFNQAISISGLVLTKLDGDARGGAALSMHAVTGKPIKFIGMGEKMEALEVFHPSRLASRILGMGDVLTLIEKASKEVSIEDSLKLQKKMKRNEFTLEDFLNQLKMVRRMGSVAGLAAMIPGLNKIAKQVDPEKAEREMKRIEAIILSMTPQERRDHQILNGSRRKRIANGSGTSVEELNRFLKQYTEMRKVMSSVAKMGMGGLMNMMGGKGMPGMFKGPK